jgi:succinoglycan biosynthesis transport protein ExoP
MRLLEQPQRSLRDIPVIVKRRRRVFLQTIGVVLCFSLCGCIFVTRRYTAQSEIELQNAIPGGLDFGSLTGNTTEAVADTMAINLDLQTQANLLQSDELALRVIKEINLEKNEDFVHKFNPLSAALSVFEPSRPIEPAGVDIDKSPRRRTNALKIFSNHLKVKVVAGTRLIQIEYSNPDPVTSCEVANHLVQALTNYHFQTRVSAMEEASGWLGGQLDDLRSKSQLLQAKVVKLQKQTGLFGLAGSDLQGKPLIYSPALDGLQQATAAVSQAEMNRVLKGAVYEVVKTGDGELISQLSGISLSGSTTSGVVNSLALLQALRTQEATLQAQVAQDSATFGPSYPQLIQERASLKRAQQSIQDEIARMAARAKNDFQIATLAASGAQKTYEKQRGEAAMLNDKTIAYSILQKEASQSQDLYQDLLKHLKEAGILQGLRASNINVVEKAREPAKPSSPNVPVYLLLGVVMAPLLAGSAAMLAESLDQSVRDAQDLGQMGLPLIAELPFSIALAQRGSLESLNDIGSRFSESVRSLRTSIVAAGKTSPPKVLLVTSPKRNEGTSTVSINLAISFAQQGKRVLFIEANLRHPVIGEWLQMSQQPGLVASFGKSSFPLAIIGKHSNLSVMPAGPAPESPADILSSTQMKNLLEEWREQFDVIVIDSAPILSYSDARILAELSDCTVLIVRTKGSTKEQLLRALTILTEHAGRRGSNPVVTVVNSVVSQSDDSLLS